MESKITNNEKPLNSKNIISKLFFYYVIKILKTGSKKIYEITDLYKLDKTLLYRKHKKKFDSYQKKKILKGWSTKKIVIRWLLKFWYIIAFLVTIVNILEIANPFILKEIINWVEEKNRSKIRGISFFLILSSIAIIKPLIHTHGIKHIHCIWVIKK